MKKYLEFREKISNPKLSSKKVYDSFYHPFKVHRTELVRKVDGQKNRDTQNWNKPCITVVILTHNRTHVACATIDYLVKNLKYDNLKWCISDDRSSGDHIETLLRRFLRNNIHNVKVLETNDEHYGLGASMNNALKYAWTNSDIVLTVEDDWILQRELDLTYYVKILEEDKNTSLIRLSYLDQRHELDPYNEFLDSVRKSTNNFIFNNQCCLRHKRIYDFLGYNKENCSGDEQEQYIRDRYNELTNFGEKYKVLWPKELKKDSLDDPSLYFVHVGKSVSGHDWYDIPHRYKWIYEEKWLKEITQSNNNIFFRIIIPSYNTSKYIKRCLDSIKKQTFKNFKVIIVDDNSDDKHITKNICNKYNFIEYIQLDKHLDAGGSRNIGLEYHKESEYTLFCDSDDYYMDRNAFQKLHDHIIENNYPECVNFSFYWSQFQRIQEPCQLEAPWSHCIKTELCQKFVSNRRKQNDVIWYLRQFDILKNITELRECLYCYTNDNPLSCSSHIKEYKFDNRVLASYFYLLADILEEKFTNQSIKEEAIKTFKIMYNRIKNNYRLDDITNVINR